MAAIYSSPRFSETDDNGRPLAGGRLYTYENGTTTPAPTYKDAAGTILNTNPIILDARGDAVIFLQPGKVYTFELRNRVNSLIWTQNDIQFSDLLGVTGPISLGTYLTQSVEKVVNSVAELRLLSKTGNTKARTTGYWTPGDRGAGEYYLDAADTTSVDNGGTVIVAADGARWKLVHNGVYQIRQFGARGGNPAFDDTQYIQACFDAALYAAVYINAGTFYCRDLKYGNNSTTEASVAPSRMYGDALASSIVALPGTTTLLSATNLAGNNIEDVSFSGNQANVSQWVFDTTWNLGVGPSTNNSWRNVWVRGSGGMGCWKADNNNDSLFQKCVIEGVDEKPCLSIIAPGGAMKLDDCIMVRGYVDTSVQNLLVNGGYNFGFRFTGIINSITVNNCYIFANHVSGSCFWGGELSAVITGGLLIAGNTSTLAGTPGKGAIFDCVFNSDSTIFNANYVGEFVGDCPILGPNAASSLGASAPVRLTLDGGTGESGTIISIADNPQVYVGTRNVRHYVGYSNVYMLNNPAPTKRGKLGPTLVPTASYIPLVPAGALVGEFEGIYQLRVTMTVSAIPFILIASTTVAIQTKISGTGLPVSMIAEAYLGGGFWNMRVRSSEPVSASASPGIEIAMDPVDLATTSITWSLTKIVSHG